MIRRRILRWVLPIVGMAIATMVCGQSVFPDDASAPLRKFPVLVLVDRPGDIGPVSLLHVPALHPSDRLTIQVGSKLAKEWTLVFATVASGQRIRVQSWNLWDRKWERDPIQIEGLPDEDIVPLFFLVLNRQHVHGVDLAIQKALATSSEQILNQTAGFEVLYLRKNRVLNFMSAYAALGPKATQDPEYLRGRVAAIDCDLGMNYDPNATHTNPGEMQTDLDAGVGVIGALRQAPDDPSAAARITQHQLPSVVADWLGLVSDLVHIFIRPPHNVKLSLIPASAAPADASEQLSEDWMQLVTERVLESKDGALPAMVYRPAFQRMGAGTTSLALDHTQVLASDSEVDAPLGASSRDLFAHPWAWGWEISDDGKTFRKLDSAVLEPGKGVVFPISASWWNGATEHDVYLRARVGFQVQDPVHMQVCRVFAQHWTPDPQSPPDLAVGDSAASVKLDRSGPAQAAYRIAEMTIIDSAGKAVPAETPSFNGSLSARFNLSGVAPGPATIVIRQEAAATPDAAVPVFIAPERPQVSFYCGKGDRVLSVSGKDAKWVENVQSPALSVQKVEDTDASDRKMTLASPLPPSVQTLTVTYHEPGTSLIWTKPEPVVIGLPRPRADITLFGSLPATIDIGPQANPHLAEASLPAGWFATNLPIRLNLVAVAPFVWSHDVTLDVGFGAAGDVQKVATIPEGSLLSIDARNPSALLTLAFDNLLKPDAPRNEGLVWLRLNRGDLSSDWSIAALESGGLPLRAVRVPTVQSVATVGITTQITIANADQVVGAIFPGLNAPVAPQLAPLVPGQPLTATITGPAGLTSFDLQFRDATEAVVHVKLTR